jgi:hypothetical protein
VNSFQKPIKTNTLCVAIAGLASGILMRKKRSYLPRPSILAASSISVEKLIKNCLIRKIYAMLTAPGSIIAEYESSKPNEFIMRKLGISRTCAGTIMRARRPMYILFLPGNVSLAREYPAIEFIMTLSVVPISATINELRNQRGNMDVSPSTNI